MNLCLCTHWFYDHTRNGTCCTHCYCTKPIPYNMPEPEKRW